ncbi:MAG: M20/M25/M40 family metallo-hydrolase [Treponema sp.]|nr:M20/M25/M40 family metallo-hydrolase [Treponema sp.]
MEDFRSLIPRFLRYVRIWTTSDRHVEETPSSPGQWELAKLLAGELRALGLTETKITDHCYVISLIPPSPGHEAKSAIGFLAHLDTAQDVSGKDVRPVVVENYDGGKIVLTGDENGPVLDPEGDSDLAAQKGKTIIHTDGTTLLGADDKAGIAEIMTVAEYLTAHPEIKHGPVVIIFSPDEETGKGLPDFPLETICAMVGPAGAGPSGGTSAAAGETSASGNLAACYTLDGGALGELEAECFNALVSKVLFTGKVIHLGQARGGLANACLMAAAFAVMLPRSESPEATDGYYGYYCPTEISGGLEKAELEVYIRDFDVNRAMERAAALEVFARAVEAQFPGGKVTVDTKVQYRNMKERIDQHPEVLAKLEEAARRTGVAVTLKPIRGGTDGSRLAELGIPTPNIFAGGRNFHALTEWALVSDMEAACALVTELVRVWGE